MPLSGSIIRDLRATGFGEFTRATLFRGETAGIAAGRSSAYSRCGISPTDYAAIRSTPYSSVIEILAFSRLPFRDPVVAPRRARIFVG